jgi:hypothetical protein
VCVYVYIYIYIYIYIIHYFNLQNNLGYTVWVGILGNPGKGQPDNGGFALNSGESVSKGLELWVWNLVCQREEVTLRLLGKLDYHCTLPNHEIKYN